MGRSLWQLLVGMDVLSAVAIEMVGTAPASLIGRGNQPGGAMLAWVRATAPSDSVPNASSTGARAPTSESEGKDAPNVFAASGTPAAVFISVLFLVVASRGVCTSSAAGGLLPRLQLSNGVSSDTSLPLANSRPIDFLLELQQRALREPLIRLLFRDGLLLARARRLEWTMVHDQLVDRKHDNQPGHER